VGLEVEVDREGALILPPGLADRVDLLVGAVHWLTVDAKPLNTPQRISAWMKTNEALLAGGVDVLAHPWRWFGRAGEPTPKHLYGHLADMLAATQTAAEINFHTNRPDPAFFAMCIERGVKIALGSDGHWMYESATFAPHLHVLQQAAGTDDPDQLAGLLFDPLS
jgi:histidinol phosphatase-like PHP family hydrolase